MNRRPAVIVDMDGTLCDVSPVIHLQAEPDGFTAFHEGCAQCPPHRAVIDWCIDHHGRGHDILIVTGRDASTRELTQQWLAEHLPVPTAGLHMRPDGDFRSNAATTGVRYFRRRNNVPPRFEGSTALSYKSSTISPYGTRRWAWPSVQVRLGSASSR